MNYETNLTDSQWEMIAEILEDGRNRLRTKCDNGRNYQYDNFLSTIQDGHVKAFVSSHFQGDIQVEGCASRCEHKKEYSFYAPKLLG